jgi:uncharacterized membrane protein YidH (DUF202 family)
VSHLPTSRPTQVSEFADPSRRTYLAAERTLLSWWRTAFAALCVALAVGRLLPELAHLRRGPFLVLGVGWGVLAAALVVCGTLRQLRGGESIKAGGFRYLDQKTTVALASYILLLTVGTVVICWRA